MKTAVKNVARAFGLDVRKALSHQEMIERQEQAQDAMWAEKFPASLIKSFRQIQRSVVCAHGPFEAVLMTDFLMRSPLQGPMVECGCYKGGSTAKLSLVAELTGRRLIVCDTFSGLPAPPNGDHLHHWFDTGEPMPYRQGDYAGSLGEVKSNVMRFGNINRCEFVQGVFSETLPRLDIADLSFIFMDVDYISSARDCLRYLWPKLAIGGRLYTHEARAREFIYGITDHAWWHENLNQCPPLLIGAGYGHGSDAPHLAFMDKD